MFSVETQTYCDGWVNTWTEEDDSPWTFETPEEAFTALAEFFEGLRAANMVDQYDVEDYRVVEIT